MGKKLHATFKKKGFRKLFKNLWGKCIDRNWILKNNFIKNIDIFFVKKELANRILNSSTKNSFKLFLRIQNLVPNQMFLNLAAFVWPEYWK